MFILLFLSCGINERKAKEYAYNNKDKLAEWCLDCFPVKPIEVIRGRVDTVVNEVLRIDTTRVTVQGDCPDGTIVNVDCPPERTSIRSIITHQTDTLMIVDTAKERVFANKINVLEKWKTAGLIGWFLFGLLLLIVFLRSRN